MTPLRQRTLKYLELKGYAPSTIRSYIHSIVKYSLHYKCCPSQLSLEQVRDYLLYLKQEKELKGSSVNSAYSALKILYVHVLRRPWDTSILPRPSRQKSLPVVLSKAEVEKIFQVCNNHKHRAILMLLYGGGLRISEVVALKVSDIDSVRMTIRIEQAKGNKDRYTLLSKSMLEQLRLYWKRYRPQDWLFVGQQGYGPYSKRSVQQIFTNCKRKAGIRKRASAHTLRHSFASHLIEAGLDISSLQQLMGHSSIRTTTRYVHLNVNHLKDFKHPVDQLDIGS